MQPTKAIKQISNQSGQGLIEYLVIVGLIAVAGIAVMSVVGQSVQGQFARVANAIQGKDDKVELVEVTEGTYRKKDMSDFFRGASKREQGSKQK